MADSGVPSGQSTRRALIVGYNRSRREYFDLVREAAALDTRMLEAKAQMEYDLARLKGTPDG